MGVFSELRRRNVLRMAALYVVVGWVAVQVADALIGLAPLPGWTGQVVLGLLAIDFPIQGDPEPAVTDQDAQGD